MIGYLIKGGLVLTSALGAGHIVGNVARSAMPLGAGRISRFLTVMGAAGLGAAAGKVSADAMRGQIEEIESWFKTPAPDAKK